MLDSDTQDSSSDSQSAYSSQSIMTTTTSPGLGNSGLIAGLSAHNQLRMDDKQYQQHVVSSIAPSGRTTTASIDMNLSHVSEGSNSTLDESMILENADTPRTTGTTDKNIHSIANSYELLASTRRAKHDIEEVDSDIQLILDTINTTYTSLSANEINRTQITQQFKEIESSLLRLNLAKNLTKYQQRTREEEYQTERQILLKSVQNFEKNLAITKNENQIITMKNLKLIKYCRSLKTDRIEKLKKENHLLKKRLYDNGIQYSDISPNRSRCRSTDALPAPTSISGVSGAGAQMTRSLTGTATARQISGRGHHRHASSTCTIPTPDSVGFEDGSHLMKGNAGPSLLDTLGRLASHVLQDEQMNGSFEQEQKENRKQQ
ncbi:unnamed protein product [Ambrosiozyma monospora]|uniref:Unnamed protein product n=1 Tax=Ambrosiozyma monospora TaxID=43982 RepID=A0ACB5T9J8_AMBMO|nr:unnamed protein product [Ambrosiozyma monospora]